jgi:hypothetical protein
MVRRKGERTKWIAEREFPHGVEIEIPPGGLGERLNLLHLWCHEHVGRDGYATTGRLQGLRHFASFRFKVEPIATEFRAFVDAIGVPKPPFSRRTFT